MDVTRIPLAAEQQGGVFTADQARAEGWSDRTIRRRIAAERWRYVAGRALAQAVRGPGPLPWTPFQLAMACHLSIPGAVTSHVTAGSIHGFPLRGDPAAHVITANRHDRVRNVVLHRLVLAPSEVWHQSGLLVTNPRRTGLDLLCSLAFGEALDLWAWLTTRTVLSTDDLQAAAAGPRRVGVVQLRRLLAAVENGAVSSAEHLLHDLLHGAGLTGWTANTPVHEGTAVIAVADVLFPAQRLIVEVDGRRAHTGARAFVHDRRRQNRLQLAGWFVLRFTWQDLTERPDDVLAEIQEALLRATA